MKNYLIIATIFLLLGSTAHSEINAGSGVVKLNKYNVNQFITYLSDTTHDKTAGVNRSGTGLVFAITVDGTDSGYYYCYKGNDCNPHTVKNQTIAHCEKKAKKNSGGEKGCAIFAIKRTIVWDNLYKKVPKNIDVENFLDELGLVSHETPPTDVDQEQLNQLKSLLENGIISQEEYNETIKQIRN